MDLEKILIFLKLKTIPKPYLDREKYKALYEYQKSQYEYQKERYFKLEDKSFRYLTFLTVLIPIFSLILTKINEKNLILVNHILILSVILGFISIVFFCAAWAYIFKSLKLQQVEILKADNELIAFFKNEILETVYLDRAKKFSFAIDKFNSVNTEKETLISNTYLYISIGSWCFLISVFLYIFFKVIPL